MVTLGAQDILHLPRAEAPYLLRDLLLPRLRKGTRIPHLTPGKHNSCTGRGYMELAILSKRDLMVWQYHPQNHEWVDYNSKW